MQKYIAVVCFVCGCGLSTGGAEGSAVPTPTTVPPGAGTVPQAGVAGAGVGEPQAGAQAAAGGTEAILPDAGAPDAGAAPPQAGVGGTAGTSVCGLFGTPPCPAAGTGGTGAAGTLDTSGCGLFGTQPCSDAGTGAAGTGTAGTGTAGSSGGTGAAGTGAVGNCAGEISCNGATGASPAQAGYRWACFPNGSPTDVVIRQVPTTGSC